jgi:hypothetical protein
MDARVTKPLVKTLLEHADALDWTTQGLGMLRTYLEPELRLHVWDRDLRAEDVSELHTHPWDFRSLVVAGQVENRRYVEIDGGEPNFNKQEIFCGQGGGLVDGDPTPVKISALPTEIFLPGDVYTQKAEEIHRSTPRSGTVTIVERHFKEDADHAFVFWPLGERWVTAEPRPATDQEIANVVGHALAAWFA